MLCNTFLYCIVQGSNTKIVCCPGGLEVLQRFVTGCSSVRLGGGGEGGGGVWTSNGIAQC